MLEIKLITPQEIADKKQLSVSSFDDKLGQIIIESQLDDLEPLLGSRLFNDVLREAAGTKYTALLDGGDYTDTAGELFYNPGLKNVLIEYVYARKIMFGDAIDNPFGFTHKLQGNQSTPLDLATKKTYYANHRQFAYNLWMKVRRFMICTNVELFDECKTKKRRSGGFKISKIGDNRRRRVAPHVSAGHGGGSGASVNVDGFPYITIGLDRIRKEGINISRTTIEIGDTIIFKDILNAGDPITLNGATYIGGDLDLLPSYEFNKTITN